MLLQQQITIGNHNDLLPLLTKGMQATAKLNSDTLGDRILYIGMSDIGRYLECPRATLANKLFSSHDQPLEHLLPLQRGHWFEAGIAPAILSQHPTTFLQLEIEVEYEGVPIRAHLDVVLVQQKPATVRIIEVKSMTRLPEALHAAHEAQVYGQIGLLPAVWNQPAFSLQGESGEVLHHRLTFPDLCKAHFGLNLPSDPEKITLEASVLGLSMNEARTYGPYLPDKSMLTLCLKNAAALWKHMATYRTWIMSINDKIEETGKLKSMSGQMVRIIDLPVDAGAGRNLFQNFHGQLDAATLSNALAGASLAHYGPPLRAFLERLCQDSETNKQRTMTALEDFVHENVPHDVSGQVIRVARKFGLIAIAGELAVEWGVFNFNKGEADAAAREWFTIWLEQRGGHGDVEMEKVLKRIQDHFATERARYAPLEAINGYLMGRLAGYTWRKDEKPYFLMLSPIFDELTRGVNRKLLRREMQNKGWLACNSSGGLMETKSVGNRNGEGWCLSLRHGKAPRNHPYRSNL